MKPLVLAALSLAIGCGSSTDATKTQGAPPTTTTCAAAPYQDRGPYVVGVTTMSIDGGVPVEVWYPADVGAEAGKTRAKYDMRDWLPAASRAKISDADAPLHEMDAYRDVAMSSATAGKKFPLALFSHGLGGYRDQTSFLMTHLASWGFVVVAPDHPERGLAIVLAGDLSKIDTSKGPDQMRAALAMMKGENEKPGGRFAAKLDLAHVAAIGHSMGGGTVATISADPEISASVLLASPGFGTLADKPLMMMWGAADGVAKPSTIEPSFDKQASGKRGVAIKDAGHMAFTDLCVIGRDKGGVLQIAIDHGLAVDDLVKQLASDGCGNQKGGAPYLGPELGWPVIDHFVTAELRAALRIDVTPIGLDDAAVKCFGDRVAKFRSE